MRLARALVILSFCFLDVRVRAADDVLDAATSRRTFALAHARVVMKKGGLATEDDGRLRLIRGTVYVMGAMEVKTPFARFACTGDCEAFFVREDDSISIESLTEGWSVTRLGDSQEYAVRAATRVVVGQVAPDGKAAVAPAQSLPWITLVQRWSALYVDGPEKFLVRVRDFRPLWDAAVWHLSEEQRERSGAMVAEHQAELSRQAARARAEADEDARLREQFRARNYVE